MLGLNGGREGFCDPLGRRFARAYAPEMREAISDKMISDLAFPKWHSMG